MGREVPISGFILIVLLGGFFSLQAHAYEDIKFNTFQREPSHLRTIKGEPETERFLISCHGTYSNGARYALECPFDFWLTQADAEDDVSSEALNAGHGPHMDKSWPEIYRNRQVTDVDGLDVSYDGTSKELEWKHDQSPGEPKRVTGITADYDTGREWADIKWPIPEVSGVAEFNAKIWSADGWWCRGTCYTPKMTWVRHFVELMVEGITQAPTADPYMGRARSKPSRDDHRNSVAFGIDPDVLPDLIQFAKIYYDASGRDLSLNDGSLPRGGLFDTKADWEPPHKSHRTGTDFDINRERVNDGTPVDCQENGWLYRAARQALPNIRDWHNGSAVNCHDNGFIHLNLTAHGG